MTAALGLDPARAREIAYLDSPYREALGGFLERRPRFFGGLDGQGSVVMRDFAAMRDLHLSHAALDQIEAMRDLFVSCWDQIVAPPSAPRRPAAKSGSGKS